MRGMIHPAPVYFSFASSPFPPSSFSFAPLCATLSSPPRCFLRLSPSLPSISSSILLPLLFSLSFLFSFFFRNVTTRKSSRVSTILEIERKYFGKNRKETIITHLKEGGGPRYWLPAFSPLVFLSFLPSLIPRRGRNCTIRRIVLLLSDHFFSRYIYIGMTIEWRENWDEDRSFCIIKRETLALFLVLLITLLPCLLFFLSLLFYFNIYFIASSFPWSILG